MGLVHKTRSKAPKSPGSPRYEVKKLGADSQVGLFSPITTSTSKAHLPPAQLISTSVAAAGSAAVCPTRGKGQLGAQTKIKLFEGQSQTHPHRLLGLTGRRSSHERLELRIQITRSLGLPRLPLLPAPTSAGRSSPRSTSSAPLSAPSATADTTLRRQSRTPRSVPRRAVAIATSGAVVGFETSEESARCGSSSL